MYEWSKRSPQEMYSMEDTMRLWGHMLNPTPLTTEYKVNNNAVNVHLDSLINVQGDVNDAAHITNQMEKVAKRMAHNEVVDFARDLNEDILYHTSSHYHKWNFKK